MSNDDALTLRSVIAAIPPDCYRKPTWKGLFYMARDLCVYGLLIAALFATDNPLLLLVLWPLTGLAISGLFILGHDAAHEALFEKRWLNSLVGHIVLLPSLHAFSVWVLGHNRIHHVYAGCKGKDFVWHPVSKEQFDAMPGWRQLWHRLEWSALGSGVYYIRAIWWRRMMLWVPLPRFAPVFRRDRLIIIAYVLLWSTGLVAFGAYQGGSFVAGFWTWLKVGVVPWVVWNYVIAISVHLHHIDEQTVWRRRADWTRYRGQVEATTNYLVPSWYNLFAHNIFLHIPHHVDPRIPFYHLPQALAALEARYGTAFGVKRLHLRDYLRATQQCKLYDFDRNLWCGYSGEPVT